MLYGPRARELTLCGTGTFIVKVLTNRRATYTGSGSSLFLSTINALRPTPGAGIVARSAEMWSM